MKSKEYIANIIINGTPAEKKILYSFDDTTTNEQVLKKFELYARGNFVRYFKVKSAQFHKEMIMNMIRSYRGDNYINLAFRGSSKTSQAKLFLSFVIQNDESHFRRYIKILSRDMKNPKQIVTDVYNMCLETRYIYGDIFEKEGDKKREETMASFTTIHGVKLTAGTVGQTQRGHVQDAYRPDWVLFDDIEDRETITSQAMTDGIISRCDEALTGLSMNGSWMLLGNYISENGVVEWFRGKRNKIEQITPIIQNGIPTWEDAFDLKKIEEIKADVDDFWGEYCCDPSRSDNKFFNIDRIESDLHNCRKPDTLVGATKYWGIYQSHHRYGIGADTGEGVGRDSSALAVFDFKTGELVCSYDSNVIQPELFAYELARVGAQFGNCVIAPEMNNMSGGIVIATLKTIYDNIYRSVDKLSVQERESTKFGWHTNARTKPQMFLDFRRDYNDGIIHIFDERVLREMKAYSNTDLSDDRLGVTRHFDLLTSVVIAWQMKDVEARTQTTVYNFGY